MNRTSPPLGELEVSDRYRFSAWLIRWLDEAEPKQIKLLAWWLFDRGVDDPDRVSRWADELDGLDDVPNSLRIARVALVRNLSDEIKALVRSPPGSARA